MLVMRVTYMFKKENIYLKVYVVGWVFCICENYVCLSNPEVEDLFDVQAV